LAVVLCVWGSITLEHSSWASASDDAIVNVSIEDFSFQPDNVTIRPPNNVTGESVKVVWTNNDPVFHTVTSGIRGSLDPVFDSGNLASGQTFNLTINQTVYDRLIDRYGSVVPYHCKIHSGMDATLNITGDPIPEYSLLTFVLILVLTFIIVSVALVRLRKH
jgi:plastocyanin